tara:strand:- start:462 stop:1016 length:555 start_codon:yes stop_codon:yes gene_type:complete
MVNEIFKDVKERMDKAVEHNRSEVATIRTGRASINILDPVKVDYYGSLQPLKTVAQISVPEPQTITIQPFDPNIIELIEKAIVSSDIGINPNNDGNIIRLTIPALTEDRRKELVRVVHKIIEEGRISVRNIRRDGNDQLKKINNTNELSDDNLKRALDDIQEMTNKHIEELNELQKNKEKEIME